jgi:hypothetical protein
MPNWRYERVAADDAVVEYDRVFRAGVVHQFARHSLTQKEWSAQWCHRGEAGACVSSSKVISDSFKDLVV